MQHGKDYYFSLYDKGRAYWVDRCQRESCAKHYVDGEYVYFLGEYIDHPRFDKHSPEYTKNNRTFDKLTETENGFTFLIRDTEKRTETKIMKTRMDCQ